MSYFLDVNIPETKNIEIALTSIYGIGRKQSIKICKKFGLNSKIRFSSLDGKLLQKLNNYIRFNYIYGFNLKRLKKQQRDSLIKIRCYRGNRHFFGYLVRGQRSKNKKLRRHI